MVYSMVGHSPVEELDDAGVPGEGPRDLTKRHLLLMTTIYTKKL